jgi:hypothetical protein
MCVSTRLDGPSNALTVHVDFKFPITRAVSIGRRFSLWRCRTGLVASRLEGVLE